MMERMIGMKEGREGKGMGRGTWEDWNEHSSIIFV